MLKVLLEWTVVILNDHFRAKHFAAFGLVCILAVPPLESITESANSKIV